MALLGIGSVLLGAGNAAVMLARYAATDLADAGALSRALGAVLLATTVGAAAGPNLLDGLARCTADMGRATRHVRPATCRPVC